MTYPHDDKDQPRGRYADDPRDPRYGAPSGAGPRDTKRNEEPPDDMIEDGDYPVVAVAHRFGWSSGKHPQIGVRIKIVDGKYKGRTLLWYGTFSDDAAKIAIQSLRALGMRGDDAERDIQSIYEGTQGIAAVKRETYEGKVRAKVQWINGAEVQMKEEMSSQDLRSFSNRMKGTFARFGGGGGSAPSQQQTTKQGNDRSQPPRDAQRSQNGNDRRDAPPPNDGDMPWDEQRRR